MRRFFVNSSDVNDSSANIYGEEFLHITRVLRSKVGQECILLDGDGYEYKAKISEITDSYVAFDISVKEYSDTEPKVKVTLYQGLPKSLKIDLIVQKCVELGINRIVPLVSKRCVKRPDKNFSKKIERLNKISKEAVKQCKRAIIPQVSDYIEFNELVKVVENHELVLICFEDEKTLSLKSVLTKSDAKDIAIIIGPEGGFEQSEVDALVSAGAQSITLGKRILRSETAGMATLAMIMYESGEMQ